MVQGLLRRLQRGEARGLPGGDAGAVRDLWGRPEPPALQELDAAELMLLMTRDKKALESGLPWVLPRRLGRAELEVVSHSEVEARLPRFLKSPWEGANATL